MGRIKPVTAKQKVRSFLAYDLEWYKGTKAPSRTFKRDVWEPKLRLVGIFDGTDYRYYRTIADFINGELTYHTRGKWFYAHAGGLADMIFLLTHLVNDHRFKVDAAFSGSSAIIVKVKRGKDTWTFIDSYWTIRAPLAKIGKTIGMLKGEVKFDTDNFAELKEYNELDCRILWSALSAFESRLLNLGGQLQKTQASSALFLFRRAFLKREIATSAFINRVARKAYFASRVEPFRAKCVNANYFDINSSFPYSMTFSCPGNLIGSGTEIRKKCINFVRATVKVPDNEYFPPLPYRHGSSVFFPTGQWEGWFTDLDLELAEETGASIINVHEALYFEPFDDLADYANTLYELRRKSTDEVDRMVYKFLLNSLYGKFAEQSEKTSLVINPDKTPHPIDICDPKVGITELFPGAYLYRKDSDGKVIREKGGIIAPEGRAVADVAHAHVPISVYITARSRANLYRFMRDAGDFYYCDTDGFATDNYPATPCHCEAGCLASKGGVYGKRGVKTSDKLGGLKHEKMVREGFFIRPKLYMVNDQVRAKGMPMKPDFDHIVDREGRRFDDLPSNHDGGCARDGLCCKDAYRTKYGLQRFMLLMSGGEIEARRFNRIREIFRKAIDRTDIKPGERIIKKGVRLGIGMAMPKRAWLQDGNSRPWTIDELQNPTEETKRAAMVDPTSLIDWGDKYAIE